MTSLAAPSPRPPAGPPSGPSPRPRPEPTPQPAKPKGARLLAAAANVVLVVLLCGGLAGLWEAGR